MNRICSRRDFTRLAAAATVGLAIGTDAWAQDSKQKAPLKIEVDPSLLIDAKVLHREVIGGHVGDGSHHSGTANGAHAATESASAGAGLALRLNGRLAGRILGQGHGR